MPDRTSSGSGGGGPVLSTLSEHLIHAPSVLPVAYPLDDFYTRAGLPLPAIETIEPGEIPEPRRSLLVHKNDMTPTLAAFHAATIQLQVLSRQHRDDFYFREVVLLAEGTEKPVEFGAIRINLALFSPIARRHILEERSPLGHLLGVHSVTHSSRPKAFFRLQADSLMIGALNLSQPQVLYGRRNTLLDSVHRPLAEVVEILPP
jgi:hypothetical protein